MEQHAASSREMKIRLPSRLATALHARKILTGEEIGKTVEAAVRRYFAAADAAAGRPAGRAPFSLLPATLALETEEVGSE